MKTFSDVFLALSLLHLLSLSSSVKKWCSYHAEIFQVTKNVLWKAESLVVRGIALLDLNHLDQGLESGFPTFQVNVLPLNYWLLRKEYPCFFPPLLFTRNSTLDFQNL